MGSIRGTGTIVALIKTDQGTDDEPHLRFVVRIEAEGIETYDAMAAATVPAAVARLLRPGARLSVRVEPHRLDEPSIDLSRFWITPSLVS